MVIDRVIVSSDNNPTYLKFWDVIKYLWFYKIGVMPVLLKITNENKVIENKDNIIINIKKVDDIDTGFQSQIVRLYASTLFDNKNILLSDIDMLPLNKNYFHNIAKQTPNNKIAVYSSDAYPKNKNRFPICYILGNSNLLAKTLVIEKDYNIFVNKLHSLNLKWDTDELYMSSKLLQNKNLLQLYNRGWVNGIANRRIDRVSWNYSKELLDKNYYIDSHSIRPYTLYKNEINKVANYESN